MDAAHGFGHRFRGNGIDGAKVIGFCNIDFDGLAVRQDIINSNFRGGDV